MYRSVHDVEMSKLLWPEVDQGKDHMANAVLTDKNEVLIYLGNEKRTVTGSMYMTFLDSRGKIICFAAGARDQDFKLV